MERSCHVCGRKYTKKNSLDWHMKHKHPSPAAKPSEDGPDTVAPPAVHSISQPAPSVSRPNRYDKPGPALITPWLLVFVAAFFLFVMYLILVVA